MAILLAKVQLGDNRDVDEIVIAYWHELIGELDLADAMAALKRFRREQPGVYLEPGHLLELVAPVDPWAGLPDITGEVVAESRRVALAAAGVSEEEYRAHEHDAAWVRSRFGMGQLE